MAFLNVLTSQSDFRSKSTCTINKYEIKNKQSKYFT